MKKNLSLLYILVFFFTTPIFTSCSSNSNNTPAATTAKEEKKEPSPAPKKPETPSERPPIINMMDTVSIRRTILFMKDSAANYSRIGMKLGEIYGFKLAAVLKKTGIKTAGQPMAWYLTRRAPYYFEAGFPVDKKPKKLPSNVKIKEIGIDSVIVAHYYGPYDQLSKAYDAVKELLKDRKKSIKGTPYEIYVDDPLDKNGKMKDPYKVQTDVVFPWK